MASAKNCRGKCWNVGIVWIVNGNVRTIEGRTVDSIVGRRDREPGRDLEDR